MVRPLSDTSAPRVARRYRARQWLRSVGGVLLLATGLLPRCYCGAAGLPRPPRAAPTSAPAPREVTRPTPDAGPEGPD